VKNVGRGAIEAIVEARERLGGRFLSLYQFCDEVDSGRVNRRVVESLILAGALDDLPGSRAQKVAALDQALSRAVRKQRDRARGQATLFGQAGGAEAAHEEDGVLPEVPPWDERDRLAKEKELIGLYLTGHPLNHYRQVLQWLGPDHARDLPNRGDDQAMSLIGVLHGLKTVTTRSSGRVMAFIALEDFSGTCEVIAFPDTYEEYRELLTGGEEIFLFAGRSSTREDEDPKLILEKAMSLETACTSLIRAVRVEVGADLGREQADRILELVRAHPGKTPFHLKLRRGEFEADLTATRAAVRPVPALLLGLAELLGPEAVHPVCLGLGGLVAPGANGRRRRRGAAAKAEH
jgi:DNA polymerase-3 subunit alpha